MKRAGSRREAKRSTGENLEHLRGVKAVRLEELADVRARRSKFAAAEPELDALELAATLGEADPGEAKNRRQLHREALSDLDAQEAQLVRLISGLDRLIAEAEQRLLEERAADACRENAARLRERRQSAEAFTATLAAATASMGDLVEARKLVEASWGEVVEACQEARLPSPKLTAEGDEPAWDYNSLASFIIDGPVRLYAQADAARRKGEAERERHREQRIRWALDKPDSLLRAQGFTEAALAEVRSRRKQHNQATKKRAAQQTREVAAQQLSEKKRRAQEEAAGRAGGRAPGRQ